MMRHLMLAAGCLSPLFFTAPMQQAEARTADSAAASENSQLETRYDVTLMGMQIGVARLNVAVDGNRYKADVWTRLTGLAGVMTDGKGAGSASGSLSGAAVVPASFAVTTASGNRSVSVRMALADGSVRALKVSPPVPNRKDRIALRDGDTRNIVDPVSALLMPVAGKALAGDPAACNRTLPLFDGSARFDIPLSFARAQKINGRAYSGTVAVCSGRYLPISGHVANREDIRFMENNRDIEVWLAPSPDGRLFLPYRIAVRSPIGQVVIEATRFPGGAPKPDLVTPTSATEKRQLRASN
ncbi:DUF3108 domain-containing protein [Pseudochelatococcus contaminans]|uniref:DUF3108 domain-containing protein n=1 Tax=Pseudochelatococcus contaminans TaxID=1538103 RepID=A0A7W5Z6N3_9HYPH|nr:DUF3108 domain-containing protein [Pseudochelatococcus contaminans]MBB3810699.1 hypothetical protein [Pseudochelatococcus contaminans]